jgi:hypothetical protein
VGESSPGKQTGPARYQEIYPEETPVRRSDGAEIRVFSGSSGGTVSATQNYAKVTLVEIRAEQGAVVEQELPAGFNAFVVVQQGIAVVGSANTKLAAGQVGWLNRSDEASTVSLKADEEGMRAFLIGGMPLHEPVAARGPFVMNTRKSLPPASRSYAPRVNASDCNPILAPPA